MQALEIAFMPITKMIPLVDGRVEVHTLPATSDFPCRMDDCDDLADNLFYIIDGNTLKHTFQCYCKKCTIKILEDFAGIKH